MRIIILEKTKTLFIDFKYLRNYFKQEVNKLTYERIFTKEMNNYVVENNSLSHNPDPELLERYKKICEEIKEKNNDKRNNL